MIIAPWFVRKSSLHSNLETHYVKKSSEENARRLFERTSELENQLTNGLQETNTLKSVHKVPVALLHPSAYQDSSTENM